ncbi:hypothetical protein [Neomegalonema perideroedes]|uniref:hypothetical protein n=1 Tax=Neomegalonema perideroedes TaxID=217219 RepID=UPI0012FE35F4|nr:hypothetical protein [Neomegalonema perideroedes]
MGRRRLHRRRDAGGDASRRGRSQPQGGHERPRENWRRAIISEQESLPAFCAHMLSSPSSLALFLAAVPTLLSQTPLFGWLRRSLGRRKPSTGAAPE